MLELWRVNVENRTRNYETLHSKCWGFFSGDTAGQRSSRGARGVAGAAATAALQGVRRSSCWAARPRRVGRGGDHGLLLEPSLVLFICYMCMCRRHLCCVGQVNKQQPGWGGYPGGLGLELPPPLAAASIISMCRLLVLGCLRCSFIHSWSHAPGSHQHTTFPLLYFLLQRKELCLLGPYVLQCHSVSSAMCLFSSVYSPEMFSLRSSMETMQCTPN